MNITKDTVRKMAHLARLELNESEEQSMANDLTKIIGWMEQLNEVETTDIKPLTHISHEINVFRDDIAHNQLNRADGLKNAPQANDSYFIVPKVME
jgi:aspartyl-tRNA(Asn)/glutamyl-tRNA(Gln) amidotransferase subunit C